MEKELSTAIEAYRQNVVKTAENVIFYIFPSKVMELQKKIESAATDVSPFHTSKDIATDTTVYSVSSDEPMSKKRRLESVETDAQSQFTGKVVSNKHIIELNEAVKNECQELASHLDKVHAWITLTIPSGDNFGVQVQEECLAELQRAQESAYNLRDFARQGYVARAKLCSKLLKYPNVEDYTIALKEHDEKQAYYARKHLVDIRNVYASMMDMLMKNISKLRAPKGNNSGGLY